jgi:hypothetical protein
MKLCQSKKVIQGDRSFHSPLGVWTSMKLSMTSVQASTHIQGNLWKNVWLSFIIHNNVLAACRPVTLLHQRNPRRHLCVSWQLICSCRLHGGRDRWWWEVTHHFGTTILEHRWSYHLRQ